MTSPESSPLEPSSPLQVVPLAELGPILKHYAAQMGHSDEKLANWYSTRHARAPAKFGPPPDDFPTWLEQFHAGSLTEEVELPLLENILGAYDDPNLLTDMPMLMAEWLVARKVTTPALALSLDRGFLIPTDVGNHGHQAAYANATLRLFGFECAFVKLTLAGNTSKKHSIEDLFQSPNEGYPLGPVAHLPPHTRPHVHPGDEYIYIVKGVARVLLENTGVFQTLTEGDYIHFTAEIPHSLWNLENGPMEALVIRFFQLNRQGIRDQQRTLLHEIFEGMAKLRTLFEKSDRNRTKPSDPDVPDDESADLSATFDKPLSALGRKLLEHWQHIEPWVRDRTRRPLDRLRPSMPRSVLDPVGLASFIDCALSQPFPDLTKSPNSPDFWQKPHGRAANEFKRQLSVANLQRLKRLRNGDLESDRSPPDSALLQQTANALEVPRALLDAFLSPPAIRVAIVRGAKHKIANPTVASEYPFGFEYVPAPEDTWEGAGAARYWLPSRTLANSDITVTRLDLKPARESGPSYSAWNRHPGFECVIPLSGRVELEFQGWNGKSLMQIDATAERDGTRPLNNLLVYRSSWPHRLRLAAGCNDASLLILRFNVVDDHAEECFKTLTTGRSSAPLVPAEPEPDTGTSPQQTGPSPELERPVWDAARRAMRWRDKVVSFKTRDGKRSLSGWRYMQYLIEEFGNRVLIKDVILKSNDYYGPEIRQDKDTGGRGVVKFDETASASTNQWLFKRCDELKKAIAEKTNGELELDWDTKTKDIVLRIRA